MLIYLRNLIIVIAVQALLIMFGLNLTVVERFELQPFSFAEVFVYCSIIAILTHNIKNYIMVNSIEPFSKILSGIATINYSMGKANLEKLQQIEDNIKGIQNEIRQDKSS